LLVTRQWKAALSMAGTSAALILITLPLVGVQAWEDWVEVGGVAAKIYEYDGNWVFLSRDLETIPHRWMLQTEEAQRAGKVRDMLMPWARTVGHIIWLSVVAT